MTRLLDHGRGALVEAASAPRFLLEGRPGVGKTTVASRLVGLLRDAGVSPSGFLTHEIRAAGSRVGFSIETLAGKRAVLAHVDLPGPPRVGKYGVDVAVLEELAIPALAGVDEDEVAVIDELGKMELSSAAFRDSVTALFERRVAVVATVLASRHPITDALKRSPRIETLAVTVQNRDNLPRELAARLAPG